VEIQTVERHGLTGAVAEIDGEEVGHLLARTADDRFSGRHAWSGLGDHGLAPGESPELYRDLYAVAGPVWAEAGFLKHYVVVPADAEVLDAWYRLSFAQQQVYAARPTESEPPRAPSGFTIREGGLADLELALELADVITRFQREPPTWSGTPLLTEAELREDWREYLEGHKGAYFLAERDARPLGHLAMTPESAESVYLEVAATRPGERGAGVGLALTEHALHWAHEQGFKTCTTDWRTANLLSSRFWPRRGFVPTAYRLVRDVTP
jgi:GNAT superfamily N-acetyltransferase